MNSNRGICPERGIWGFESDKWGSGSSITAGASPRSHSGDIEQTNGLDGMLHDWTHSPPDTQPPLSTCAKTRAPCQLFDPCPLPWSGVSRDCSHEVTPCIADTRAGVWFPSSMRKVLELALSLQRRTWKRTYALSQRARQTRSSSPGAHRGNLRVGVACGRRGVEGAVGRKGDQHAMVVRADDVGEIRQGKRRSHQTVLLL